MPGAGLKMTFTAADKAKAARREAKYRARVYPRLVENGNMSQSAADYQTAIMAEIAADYEGLVAAKDRLL